MRKSQGLSFNAIIVAALCLLVLVIIFFIMSGKLKWFGTGVKEEVKLQKCPGSIKLAETCQKALLGNYGKPNKTNPTGPLVPLELWEVCCEK